jgi:Zn-finger nucleic acid-binding protein
VFRLDLIAPELLTVLEAYKRLDAEVMYCPRCRETIETTGPCEKHATEFETLEKQAEELVKKAMEDDK